jgi:hypothetical protein
MKKAKIMLTAITVLAIVGGALAFKAKKFSIDYCTTLTTTGGCRIFTPQQKAGTGTATIFYAVDDGSQCADNLPCNALPTTLVGE